MSVEKFTHRKRDKQKEWPVPGGFPRLFFLLSKPNTQHRAGRAAVTQGRVWGFTAPFPLDFNDLARVFLPREARLGTRAQPNFRLFLILLAKNPVLYYKNAK